MPAGFVQTYAPGKVVVTLGGVICSGFGDEIVTVKRLEPVFKIEVGADGEVSRRQSANKAGEAKITCKQNSSANAALGSLLAADELYGGQVLPLYIADNAGHQMFSGQAWVQGWPEDIKRAKEESPVVWTIDCSELTILFSPLPVTV